MCRVVEVVVEGDVDNGGEYHLDGKGVQVQLTVAFLDGSKMAGLI
ncbi:hypothetical protein Patl1_33976 [Pistacia atlantica]|uniref:Uncharacterized protein n=1 Tax=Pistacia atlantica TaxID=434234 RepID=A0ACC0ZRE4_9ROSI|nr:hypothetical protein Patl1_33976 [Pistacia atlantica]